MSRFTIREPLAAAQRHTRKGSPTRTISHVLSTFDAELARLQDHRDHAHDEKAGNTLGSATSTSGTHRPLFPVQNTSAPRVVTRPPQDDERSFPLYSYKSHSPPSVLMYIRDEAEADEQVSKLKGPLGFDLEWRVIFGKGAGERKTAILQLCDLQTILIIQLSAMKGFPAKVKAVVGDENIVKMGINILGDGRKLYRDYGVVSRGLLELTNLAHLVDPTRVPTRRMISLKRIVELYTGYTLAKGGVQTSNWEAKLSEKQLQYAANDAHSALRVYNELMRMAREKEMVLQPVITPSHTGQPTMGMTYASSLPTDGTGTSTATTTAEGAARRYQPGPSAQAAPPRYVRYGVVPVTSLEQREGVANDRLKRPVQGQLLRAYKLWHEQRLALPDICSALRSADNPLAQSTVITYIVEALKADDGLAFSRERLKELAMLDFGSWRRHRWWIGSLEDTDRGLEQQ